MKLILLLSVLCFTSAFAGDNVIMSYYMKAGCKDADRILYFSAGMKLGCKKVDGGSVNYKKDGNKLVFDSYTSADCSGTKAAGPTDSGTVLGTCVAIGTYSIEHNTMSDSVWNSHKTGGENMISKTYSGSDTCGGDVSQTSVMLASAKGACMISGSGATNSEAVTWTSAAATSTKYGTTDCTGTIIATDVKNFNVCKNETSGSSIASSNPAVSSGTKLTGFTSTLFLLCVGDQA